MACERSEARSDPVPGVDHRRITEGYTYPPHTLL